MLFRVLIAWLLTVSAATAAEPAPVDFARDVLPILSDNCYKCHGPDVKARKGDLRLDTKEDALRTENAVIVPGKSGQSELFRRIVTEDADELMPPRKSNKKLTSTQIATLKRWIDGGAKWGQHWAFIAPVKPTVPAKTAN